MNILVFYIIQSSSMLVTQRGDRASPDCDALVVSDLVPDHFGVKEIYYKCLASVSMHVPANTCLSLCVCVGHVYLCLFSKHTEV